MRRSEAPLGCTCRVTGRGSLRENSKPWRSYSLCACTYNYIGYSFLHTQYILRLLLAPYMHDREKDTLCSMDLLGLLELSNSVTVLLHKWRQGKLKDEVYQL